MFMLANTLVAVRCSTFVVYVVVVVARVSFAADEGGQALLILLIRLSVSHIFSTKNIELN